jgi:hypothetical protein
MMLKSTSNTLLILALVCVMGCGSEKSSSIKGSITLDGEPLVLGNLTFSPITPETNKKVATAVNNGTYNLENHAGFNPGSYRVEINWAKKTGKKVPSADPGILMEQTIQGTINEEIKIEKGANEKDFKLKSK